LVKILFLNKQALFNENAILKFKAYFLAYCSKSGFFFFFFFFYVVRHFLNVPPNETFCIKNSIHNLHLGYGWNNLSGHKKERKKEKKKVRWRKIKWWDGNNGLKLKNHIFRKISTPLTSPQIFNSLFYVL